MVERRPPVHRVGAVDERNPGVARLNRESVGSLLQDRQIECRPVERLHDTHRRTEQELERQNARARLDLRRSTSLDRQ
jgi:hypothetical protein